jgi:hypothetical protein
MVTGAPVLFLDFDGVLHPGSGQGETRFIHAKALEAALYGLSVLVVVSSQGCLATSRRRPLYICPDRLVSHQAGIIAMLIDLGGQSFL